MQHKRRLDIKREFKVRAKDGGRKISSLSIFRSDEAIQGVAFCHLIKVMNFKELGYYENEDFLRREFQMNLDGNHFTFKFFFPCD